MVVKAIKTYRLQFFDGRKNIALLNGMETALYIKELYKKSYTEETPVEVFTHNQTLLEALKSSKL